MCHDSGPHTASSQNFVPGFALADYWTTTKFYFMPKQANSLDPKHFLNFYKERSGIHTAADSAALLSELEQAGVQAASWLLVRAHPTRARAHSQRRHRQNPFGLRFFIRC